jgi:hypothetical protein
VPNLFFAASWGFGQDDDVGKIILPETWAGVAEPLRALMAEVERAAHADGSEIPDVAAVSAHWAQVRDAIHATVRARIVDAQSAQVRVPKR